MPDDIAAHPLLRVAMRAVAREHPLASLERPVQPSEIEQHVQLVLSDQVDSAGASYGLISARRWRFVDLARRMDFLLAGFGWCRMPEHLVAPALAAGRLIGIEIEGAPVRRDDLTIYAAHRRDRAPGPAGRWLLDGLDDRLAGRGPPIT